ncbi:protein SIX6OS1 [Eublepharis macularius]|uniref:Protein SIX6OS1 n=1 Tax=Eublepharis macularius TaxID=481883 RepID=A0AA97KSC2_EUBMA|nr:protein SIX6OS1 [Eublepharis macularius]
MGRPGLLDRSSARPPLSYRAPVQRVRRNLRRARGGGNGTPEAPKRPASKKSTGSVWKKYHYKMNDDVLSTLDKLVLQFVFKLEQESYRKEHVRQQIQIHTGNVVGKKGKVCWLQEEINKNDEVIVGLQRNNSSKENCNVWKPTYMILNKHEDYLQRELQNGMDATEKDKKMYQDYMNQYEETFKQHQAKYLGMPVVQKNMEFKEIQNRVLKLSELVKQKESEIMDLQEPGPFQSLSYWASQIASLRQNTKETLQHAAVLRQQSLELEKTAEELEKKMNSFRQKLERITEDQNHSEVGQEKSEKNHETRKEFDPSLLKMGVQPHLLNEECQKYKPLHFPIISQKSIWSIPTLKPLHQQPETDVQEKENSARLSAVTSIYFSHVENETQKCNDTTETYNAKAAQVTSMTSLQKETQFSAMFHVVDGQTECSIKSVGHNSASGDEHAENFPRTPELNLSVKTPESNEAPFELLQTENEGSRSKSPGFCFLSSFNAKSPGFNFFESSAFGAEQSPDHQIGKNYSAGNLNPVSPHESIGDLFGKMESEDSFAFSFPSCSSVQIFQDGKDNFSFPFAFGSQPASQKGFQSSSQSKKAFSLF